MSAQEVFFLGAGIHTCLGKGIESNLHALRRPPLPPALQCTEVAGETLSIPFNLLAESPLQASEQRLYRVVGEVAEEALAEAGLSPLQRRQTGIYLGSSSFDLSVTEARFQRELRQGEGEGALALRDPSVARLTEHLMQSLGLRGQDYSFSTACTSSANALLAAVARVEAGLLEHALVLGVELYNDMTALGFHGLGLLTRSVMKPFAADRDGLALGEGVSALLIGRAPADGTRRFYLCGGATLSDTYSISTCKPDGSTIAAVMRQALSRAGLEAGEVDGLKIHGTASTSSDEVEAAGMHRIFSRLPKLCALKPFIGHTLGACGLNELILFYRAAEAGFLVATPGITAVPGDLGVALNQEFDAVEPGHFMLNYFGFGGNNTSLLISNL